MASLEQLMVWAFGAAFITAPVVGLVSRIIVGSEIRPEAKPSFRQAFFIKTSELTPWGIRARTFFRWYWLALAIAFCAALVRTLLP